MRSLKLLMLVLMCVLPPISFAEKRSGNAYFEELKARYLKLRNTDVEIVRAGEWETLARQFEHYVDTNPKAKGAPFGLYDASILFEQLYRRFGGVDRLQKSCALLERVAKEYPGHEIADDALLRRGDLLLREAGQAGEARRAYEEIVAAYPNSDMRDAAAARLKELDGKAGRAPSAPSAERAPALTGARTRPLVVLDPGHGGEDFGAIGRGGLLEKDVVLAIALELEKLLTARLPVLVRLTRRKDVFVPLAERTAMANDYEADLFVSLHVNADPSGKAEGFEMYYLDNAGDQGSMKLAERENASVKYEAEQNDLYFMLSDLIQNAKLDDSILLANVVQQKLGRFMAPKWSGAKGRGVKKAPFYVLVGAHMPCIVAELFFINHARDGANLGRPEFRRDVAEGLFWGIQEFLERQSR